MIKASAAESLLYSHLLPRYVVPKYYIHTDDGHTSYQESKPFEYSELQDARREALRALHEMAHDVIPDGDRRTFTVSIADEQGFVAYSTNPRLGRPMERRSHVTVVMQIMSLILYMTVLLPSAEHRRVAIRRQTQPKSCMPFLGNSSLNLGCSPRG